jgi:hypothetical protein
VDIAQNTFLGAVDPPTLRRPQRSRAALWRHPMRDSENHRPRAESGVRHSSGPIERTVQQHHVSRDPAQQLDQLRRMAAEALIVIAWTS